MMDETELTALMIAPDRELARQFHQTLAKTRSFQILADLRSYPPLAALDLRLRQLRPDVVLLDLATNFELAGEFIGALASGYPSIQVVGLHRRNDLDAILQSLRLGAVEFLHAPFEAVAQRDAVERIQRLRQQPDVTARPKPGTVVMFSSSKPGSGASTLAAQTAFALKRVTGKRVLLADFDLMSGTVAFHLKLRPHHSVVDALRCSDRMEPLRWNSLVQHTQGLDALPAPELPSEEGIDPARLQDFLEYARMLYDWVVVDLPPIFQGISLLALSHSDRAFLVSTSELPSLHLTRKAVDLLGQIGFGKDRFQVLVNRAGKHEGICEEDLGKIFNCPTEAILPNDYFALHRAVAAGRPLEHGCELAGSIERFARRLAGMKQERNTRATLWEKAKLMFTPAGNLGETHALGR
jgi:pilus assembly protein CpaE